MQVYVQSNAGAGGGGADVVHPDSPIQGLRIWLGPRADLPAVRTNDTVYFINDEEA